MAIFELHIAGPSLDVVRQLRPNDPELVLGRDPGCHVCLPDPQRNVSRKHLVMWLADDELHFRVLSTVNGVETPTGEIPPGGEGVLSPGQTMRLADYTVTAEHREPLADSDPWAALHSDGSGTIARPLTRTFMAPITGGFKVPEDDPFGEWGFTTTLGPAGQLSTGNQPASEAEALAAFLTGLGLLHTDVAQLGIADFEAFGRTVRSALLGLVEQRRVVTQIVAKAENAVARPKADNPLGKDWPAHTMLRYFLAGGSGYVSPERALGEIIGDLTAHHAAVPVAGRAAVEGALRELDPAALRSQLLGPGAKLFEGVRAWDALNKHYVQQAQNMSLWAQRLFDKYFTQAYLQETMTNRVGASGPDE